MSDRAGLLNKCWFKETNQNISLEVRSLITNRAKVFHVKASGGKAVEDCLFWCTSEEMKNKAGTRQKGGEANPLRTCQGNLEEASPDYVP